MELSHHWNTYAGMKKHKSVIRCLPFNG